MPEGPEVSYMADKLNSILNNTNLVNIVFAVGSRYYKKAPENYEVLKARLPLLIKNVGNKGKFIYFILDGGIILFQTLGMAGGWYVSPQKSLSWTLHYDNKELYMVDTRHFATLKILINDAKTELNKKLETLGPDLMAYFSNISDEKAFIKEFIAKMRKNNNKNITIVLMNQKLYSGIGNYLKSEILNAANIHPLTNINQLSDDKLIILYDAIKKIFITSIKHNKTSKYSNILMPSTDIECAVYQKKFTKDGIKVEKIITPDKRTTYYRTNI